MRPMSRIEPKIPPSAMKTYQILAPRQTHWKTVTCEEANCEAYQNGWKTILDEQMNQGQAGAYYIRKEGGRKYSEEKDTVGRTIFTFPPGQKCFREHRERIDRPELFIVRDGDHRHYGPPRKHANADDWLEDFGNHQLNLQEQSRKG